MAGKAGFSFWKNGSQLFFRALVALAFVLLLSGVGMLIWGCRVYYQYQQYLKALKYNFGDTAVITVTSAEGSCELAPLNRYALYTFLSDSTGKRVEKSDDPLGQTITFTGKSAVGSVSGSIDQTESGVRVTLADEDDEWVYYFYNNNSFEDYLRLCSPEGWTVANLPVGG